MAETNLTYNQLTAMMLGAKLTQISKLPDEKIAQEIKRVYAEVREYLVTVGLRKRKTGPTGPRKQKGSNNGTQGSKPIAPKQDK